MITKGDLTVRLVIVGARKYCCYLVNKLCLTLLQSHGL